MIRTRWILTATAALSLGGTSCTPPTPQQVAQTTTARTSALVGEASESAQTVNTLSAFSTLRKGEAAYSGDPCLDADGGCPTPQVPPKDDFDAQMAKLSDFLQTKVFVDENKESSDASSVTFLLHGSVVCAPAADAGTTTSPECVAAVDRSQIRVKALPQSDDGINLEILIGPEKSQLFELDLTQASIAFVQDLPASKKAYLFLVEANSAQAPQLPDVFDGKWKLSLTRNGDHDFTLAASVLSDLHIEWKDSAQNQYVVKTKTKDPLVSVRVAAPEKKLTFDLDLGETFFSGPYSFTTSSPRLLNVSLAGASAHFTAQEGAEAITFGNVGLGDAQSWVSVDGEQIFSLDVNADAGRHFDVSVTKAEDDLPVIAITQQLALAATFDFTTLDTDPANPVPAYFKGMSYFLDLIGDGSVTVKPVRAAGDFAGGLKFVHGHLRFATSDASVPAVEVAEGQCLVSQTPAEGANPVTGFSSAACP